MVFRVWTVIGVLAAIAGQASAQQVSGTVRASASGDPIVGALVSLQAAGLRTTTGVDGTYAFDLPNGTDLVVVAAAKGYFNTGTSVTPPATGVDFSLDTVPQDDDPNYQFIHPTSCGGCHPDQYEEWVNSPMAHAGHNTWVADIYNGSGTPGGMGGFVYTRDSAFADSNPASECAACHQPERWIENPFTPLEDPSDLPSEAVLHGISCDICHKIADVNVANINYPGVFAGGVTLTRPAGDPVHQVQYGVLGDTNFMFEPLMRPSYQPQLVAETCGACHQDKNDIHEDHSFAGVTSEPTYIEWIESPYGDPESPQFATCVDCHMPASDATDICTLLYPPLQRTGIKSHVILGTTPQYLENAVELSMQTQLVGDEIGVTVTINNSLTGHHVPTGVTVRNMILVVEAWPVGGDPLTSSLAHLGNQTIHDLGGVGDPAQGYYAGMAGKFYAKVNHDQNGNGPTFFTDATGIQFDNRIPALQSDVTNYTFRAPSEGGPINVRARLIYRRAFRFLVDAKQWTQDGHGNPLGDVQPPHYGHLMESEESLLQVPDLGACCQPDLSCALVSEIECIAVSDDTWAGPDTHCDDDDGDGVADACVFAEAVPTVSSWGLLILALALLVSAKIWHCSQRELPT